MLRMLDGFERSALGTLVAALSVALLAGPAALGAQEFEVVEATIADAHAAMDAGRLT